MHVSYLINQKEQEKVIYALHRHVITFIPIIFVFFLLLLIPVAVYFMFLNVGPQFLENEVSYAILVLLGSIYYLSVALFFYGQFIDFHLDIWVVTNERIVDIEQHGLLSRSITEIELRRIQDVTASSHGIFETLFHYGDVVVKTASDTSDIIFRNVPYPDKIRETLVKMTSDERKSHYAGGQGM